MMASESVRKSWIDPLMCTGCRSCEIACSFHHTGEFIPSTSSINILLDRSTGEVEIQILDTCDGCLNESSPPLCIEFCPREVLSSKLLGLTSE
jgi:carbon-monoxide dehydrogenase iron sulfur subunit